MTNTFPPVLHARDPTTQISVKPGYLRSSPALTSKLIITAEMDDKYNQYVLGRNPQASIRRVHNISKMPHVQIQQYQS